MKNLIIIFLMVFMNNVSANNNNNWWETEKPDYLDDKSLIKVTQLRDLSYGLEERQKLDVYLPKISNGKTLFLIHGGAWMSGDKRSANLIVNKVNYWSLQGYIVVAVNYRLVPQVTVKEQLQDIQKAFLFVQANINEWGSKKTNIIIIGHSSGGHLATLFGSSGQFEFPPRAIVSLDGAGYDIEEIMNSRHPKFFDSVFKDATQWKNYSPLHHAKKSSIVYLLVCAKGSNQWCKQAEQFSDKINENEGYAFLYKTQFNHEQVNSLLGVDKEYTTMMDEFIEALNLKK